MNHEKFGWMCSFAFLAVAIGRKLRRLPSCLFLVDWCSWYDIMMLFDDVSGGHCCNSYPQLVGIEAFCMPCCDGCVKGKLCIAYTAQFSTDFNFDGENKIQYSIGLCQLATMQPWNGIAMWPVWKFCAVEHANMSRCQMRILGCWCGWWESWSTWTKYTCTKIWWCKLLTVLQ